MIFVTVGSSSFDPLIRKVDELAGSGELQEKVLAQIGKGDYKPKNIEFYPTKPSITKDIKQAELVISHNGAGTLLELVNSNVKTIALVNQEIVQNPDIIEKFDQESYLLWCKDIDSLGECIKRARKQEFERYEKPECTIHEEIKRFLK